MLTDSNGGLRKGYNIPRKQKQTHDTELVFWRKDQTLSSLIAQFNYQWDKTATCQALLYGRKDHDSEKNTLTF